MFGAAWEGEFALPPIPLFKVECGVLEFGREHDEGRFAVGSAKVACATHNTEMPDGPDIGHRGAPAKNELSIGKHGCDNTLDAFE